jgi:hypothetical protein
MYRKRKDIRKGIQIAAFVFVPSVFGEKFQQLNFVRYRQKLLARKKKENSHMFNEDFYLPLYLPLWFAPGFLIRIRINLICWIRIRIQEGKNRKKSRIFMFLSTGCSLLKAEGIK